MGQDCHFSKEPFAIMFPNWLSMEENDPVHCEDSLVDTTYLIPNTGQPHPCF